MIDMSIIGKKFGRLIVLEFSHQNKYGSTWWICKCDCGNKKSVYRGSLTCGDIQSCGCLREENKHKYGFKHGKTNDSLYKVWSGMIQRCTNSNATNFGRYGGRGIKVCDEWKGDFRYFYEWSVKNGYEKGLSIDRVDPNGDYEPTNCRWVTLKIQANNTRRNRFITYKGVTKTLSEWSNILKIKPNTLSYRIQKWSLEKTFETLPYSELITLKTKEQ